MTTYTEANVVSLLNTKLEADTTLSGMSNLKTLTSHDRIPLDTVSKESDVPRGGTNQRIIIYPLAGPRQKSCCGGMLAEQVYNVAVEIACRTVTKSTSEAQTDCDTITARIRQIMFTDQSLGTGWLYHNLIEDRSLRVPMQDWVSHRLVYEVHTLSSYL